MLLLCACVGRANYTPLLSNERKTKLLYLPLRHLLSNLLLQLFLSSQIHVSFIVKASFQMPTHTS